MTTSANPTDAQLAETAREIDERVSELALHDVLTSLQQQPSTLTIPYLCVMVQVCCELLRRGGEKDAFVRLLLDQAREDLNRPSRFSCHSQRMN